MAQILHAAFSSIFGSVSAAQKIAEDTIRWLTLEEGMYRAKTEQKILLAWIEEEGCNDCDHLMWSLRSSKDMQKLAQNFIMARVPAKKVEKDRVFHPDGDYVPRVLFFDWNGKLMPAAKRNLNAKKCRYNYQNMKELVASMKRLSENPSKFIKLERYAEHIN